MIMEDECNTYVNYKDSQEITYEQLKNLVESSSINGATFSVIPG